MNLQTWASEAIAHWKEFSPSLYKGLVKDGQLEERAKQAAERTFEELRELTDSGLKEYEAWEMVRERYLFTPPEKPEKEPPPSEWRRLEIEANRFQNKSLETIYWTDETTA
jgi:hypothetical protein